MIIKNVMLPSNIQLEIVGGPMYNTSVVESGAGWTQANANWSEALWAWKIRYIRRAHSFDPLISFFLEMKGQAFGFLFKDWTDFDSNYKDRDNGGVQGIGKVRQINGIYRIVKEYPSVSGGNPYVRVIQRPKQGTVTLSGVSGTPVVDYDTGIVSGATSEGNAEFEFNVPVRFSSDRMEFRQDPATVTDWADIGIQEVRVDEVEQ